MAKSIASKHMELFFVTVFPSFRPTKLAMRVCPRAFGGRICAGRCALLGHSQDDCLHAISPTRNISILASHKLQPGGKSQSHVSTDFSPLGQAVHQVGTAPALSKAQLAAGFHWAEWAEFKNGTSGFIARTLANEWPFRRMYLRTHTHTHTPTSSSPPGCCPLQQVFKRVPGQSGQAIQIWGRCSMSTSKSSRPRLKEK